MHYTKLSRLLNDKELPNLDILYRIEIHTGKVISALRWWKLMIKKMEMDIRLDETARMEAAAKVENMVLVTN